MSKAEYKAHIHHIEQTPSGVMFVWLDLIDRFDHLHMPGQYLQLNLGGEWSFFSIASVACQKSPLELHIQTKDQEKIDFLLDAFAHKKLIDVKYAFGVVKWPQSLDAGSFICRGTGFAPAKALIESALSRNADREIHLTWEAEVTSELYFTRWLLSTIKANKNFTATLYFVDGQLPEIAEKPARLTLVPTSIDQDILSSDQANKTWYYLCASPARVYEWADALNAKGVTDAQLASDVFEYAPRG